MPRPTGEWGRSCAYSRANDPRKRGREFEFVGAGARPCECIRELTPPCAFFRNTSRRAKLSVMQLAPYAMDVRRSRGRRYPETAHPYRNDYARDRDRVVRFARFPAARGEDACFHHALLRPFSQSPHPYARSNANRSHRSWRACGLKARIFAEVLALVH